MLKYTVEAKSDGSKHIRFNGDREAKIASLEAALAELQAREQARDPAFKPKHPIKTGA